MKKTIKLGSPKLDEPGIGSKAKFIPSFDLNLEKPDDVPRLIENDLEHKNVQFSDSTKKYDLRIESRNVHNTKVDINDTNVFMDHFEDYQKTNPDELLYELQENSENKVFFIETNDTNDLFRKLGIGDLGEFQVFERPKANYSSHMNLDMNVGNPKIVGSFLRPQNNSNLKNNLVMNDNKAAKAAAKSWKIL